MRPTDLLREAAARLEDLGIDYVTTGSMASSVYGEGRLTYDIDLVIRVSAADVERLCGTFSASEYYVSTSAAREAVKHRSLFNVIHPASGLKIDFVVAKDDAFDQSRFERARRIEVLPGLVASFASPEDVILKKLVFYQEGGSDKHLRDIRGILKTCRNSIDSEYIRRWVATLGVDAEWELVGDRT